MGATTSKRSPLSLHSTSSRGKRALPCREDERRGVEPTSSFTHTLEKWTCAVMETENPLRVAPSPRSGHVMCRVGKIVYLFAGCGKLNGLEDQCLNDLYAFDVETLRWTLIEYAKGSDIPSVRRSAAMCVVGNTLVLSGGAGNDPDDLRSDLYTFDTKTRIWTKKLEGASAAPFCLCGQSAVAYNGKVIYFGGSTGLEYSNSMYVYDVETNIWTHLATTGSIPSPRYKHQVVIHGASMYVIGGGCFKPEGEVVDVYKLNLHSLRWTVVSTTGDMPVARVAHSSAYDPDGGGFVYIWGGFTARLQCLRDFHRLSLADNTWTTISTSRADPLPSARSFHCSAFCEGAVYLFSGSNGMDKFSDVWRYEVTGKVPSLLTLSARAICRNEGRKQQTTCHHKAPSIEYGPKHGGCLGRMPAPADAISMTPTTPTPRWQLPKGSENLPRELQRALRNLDLKADVIF